MLAPGRSDTWQSHMCKRFNCHKFVWAKLTVRNFRWSDGLGNPRENSLPKCQLSRLQAMVNALYPDEIHPVRFWMDTLCVPVGKEHKDLRKKSISLMRDLPIRLFSRARNKPSRFKPSQAALDQIKQPSRLGLAWYISPTIRAPPAFLFISISLAPSTASSI